MTMEGPYILTKATYAAVKEHGAINNGKCFGRDFVIHPFDVPDWAKHLRSVGIEVKDEVFLK